jgi:hypothetical protein
MKRLEEITIQMHRAEKRLQFLNHKYNYDTEKMPVGERLEYNNLQNNWDKMKRKRDAIKDGITTEQTDQEYNAIKGINS